MTGGELVTKHENGDASKGHGISAAFEDDMDEMEPASDESADTVKRPAVSSEEVHLAV